MDSGEVKYKTLNIVEHKMIVDDDELVKRLLQIKTVHERMVFELCKEVDEKEVRTTIRMLQYLLK